MPFTADDCRRARLDFPALSRRCATAPEQPLAFLDGPAGSQVPRQVIDAIAADSRDCTANSHGEFATARRWDEIVHETRETVATFLGAESWRCVSFGANMTTLAFALSHALRRTPGLLRAGDEVVVTALDHEANRGPWLALAEAVGMTVREVALRDDGTLDVADLEEKIGARTRLVAVGLASNALGTVNDLAVRRARERAREVGALLVVDAVHAAPHFALDAGASDVDFLLCSAYKFYGPHVGILYARPGLLDTLVTDRLRTQDPAAPWRIETGTPNHAALAGVGAAIEYVAGFGAGATLRERLLDAFAGIGEWEGALARRYWDEIARVPGVRRYGPGFDAGRRAPTVSITLAGVGAEELARRLGERGVQVWNGHFYAQRAVEVLGLEDVGGLLRTGFLLYNTSDEVELLVAGVAEAADVVVAR